MICSSTANEDAWRGSADAGTSRTAVTGCDEAPICRRRKVSALCSAHLQSTVRVEQKGADIQPKMAATAFRTSVPVSLNCDDKIWYLVTVSFQIVLHTLFSNPSLRERNI